MRASYAPRGLDQVRMKAAYRRLEGASDADKRAWKQVVTGLGAEVQRCGLLQALAFAHRGPNKALAEPLCQALREHLVKTRQLTGEMPRSGFLVEVRDLDRATYMRVTREVIAFAVWLKRAAEILSPSDKPKEISHA
jgi:CRISPR-associated protein Cmr5